MNSTSSPFYEIRKAIEHNPIRLAEEFINEGDNEDAYVLEKVKQGNWITIGSNEDIASFRQLGYCNMVYIPVSAGFI